jgi:hypothetical protein
MPKIILILLFLGIFFSGCATTSNIHSPGGEASRAAPSDEERWGVRVVRLSLTAADHMIDFRYRVLDPQKAAPLLNRRIKPYLIDQESGTKLGVPRHSKLGPARQISDEPETNRVYTMLFGNAGKIVKPGSRVTIVIGEIRLENLRVE